MHVACCFYTAMPTTYYGVYSIHNNQRIMKMCVVYKLNVIDGNAYNEMIHNLNLMRFECEIHEEIYNFSQLA